NVGFMVYIVLNLVGGVVTLTSGATHDQVTYELAGVRRFSYFEDNVQSAIGEVEAGGAMSVALTPAGVSVSGAPAGSLCCVYDLSGANVRAVKFDGSLTLDVCDFPPGVYVVKVNGLYGLKIMIR
ncbi:MAG: T9SS type A sorting domain-containing protein, partial [Muribaculaceae bacterium]|nr:T9SS type A sorting domain-containing protein [Muribaculaceae bacterium]